MLAPKTCCPLRRPAGRFNCSIAETLSSNGSGESVDVNGYLVPTSATTCPGATFDTQLCEGKTGPPVTVSLPTPLQYKPPANKKACVFAFETSTADETALNVVGFYG